MVEGGRNAPKFQTRRKTMTIKTKVKAGLAPPPLSGGTLLVTTRNHNETVAFGLPVSKLAPKAVVESEKTELEAIAAALPVRSGLQAGDSSARFLIPCL
jgi:hypothetical protein